MKPFVIPDYWTAEQALAVYDFIDAIRDEIWSRYEIQLKTTRGVLMKI